jgi:glutamine---fructose-6-phosphate transaminase (isomerizing)
MSQTYDEIRSQSAVWRATLEAATQQWERASKLIRIQPDTQFLLVGSGSSLYVARTAASSLQEATSHFSRAVASSDVFLSSASTIPTGIPVVAFIISRSGETTEAVTAAQFLVANFPNATVIGVTTNSDSELERGSHFTIKLPHAVEDSVVMTRSFTSMLLALELIAADVSSNDALRRELERLPDLFDAEIGGFEQFSLPIAADLAQTQFIYLGLGLYEGLAQEGTLKLKEMTQTTCEAYNPLEFRHGPMSIVRTGTTVVVLEALRERAFMADVESDLTAHGAFVAAISPYQLANANVRLRLPGGISDIARSLLYVPALQLIGYYRAVAAGLDPDQPRNLTRVVLLPNAPPA